WQLTHLFNPRLTVKDSVMPPYPWLFNKDASQPTAEASDLLAYLKSLGRARQLADVDQQALPYYCLCTDDMKRLETRSTREYVNVNRARQSREAVAISLPAEAAELANYKKHGADV